MKRLLVLILLFPLYNFSQENLVPNGGFNNTSYQGGNNPVAYYTADANCPVGRERFENDVQPWKVAETNASLAELNNVDNIFTRSCSPDWIFTGYFDAGTQCYNVEQTPYVASAYIKESIMVELKNGYKLKKGYSYKFRIKARAATGSGSFQLVFSTDKKGLNVNSNKKWVAADAFYMGQSCEWKYFEVYFTVPIDNNKKYEDMKYLVLQYNHDKMNPNNEKLTIHYDDVFLAESKKCEDIKYIQDWQYVNENKIEQANVAIHAGAHVSPYIWPANNPVIVKSSAKVIYRAPSVFLEPGFFIEEPGSYFETQVGTCVDDPCPQVPSFSPPPVVNCNLPIELGNDLPLEPGVFYTWQPEELFESPWSRTTNFNPPTGSGCLEAKLVAWTICGQQKTYPFTLQYFDGPPVITIPNVINNSYQINFNLGISNANSYTVQLLNPTTLEVLYEDSRTITCNSYGSTVNINIKQCDVSLCRDYILKVIANNGCSDPVIVTRNLGKPIVSAPQIDIHNLVATDFDLQFDLFVTQNYEYLTVETWNESMTELVCSKTYSRCGTPLTNFSLHYDIKNCLGDCPTKCKNYKIKIRLKNYCNDIEDSEIINWNKTSNTFSMPSSYPNVITLNNDGINESLCFSPTAADYYHLVVVDRWGLTRFEQSGCVNSDPFCIWTPPANTPTDVYFYDVTFSNECGQTDTQHNFVQVFNSTRINQNDESNEWLTTNSISVSPNPTSSTITISSSNPLLEVELQDLSGKIILYDKIMETNNHFISLENNNSGLYILKVKTTSGYYYEKIEKR